MSLRARPRSFGRRHRWVMVVAFVVCLGGTTVAMAAASAGTLVLGSVNTREYPRVSMGIGVPAELLASGQPTFKVTENGEEVPVLSATTEKKELPYEVVLVIDTSGSMKGQAIEDARRAAREFIALMPPEASVALVGVSSEPQELSGFTSSKASLNHAVSGLQASGETAVYDSLLLATRLKGLKSTSGRPPERTIVLMSDGGDTTSVTTLDQVLRVLRDEATPVLAVAIQSSQFNQGALQLLARQSGGRLTSVRDSGQLVDYLQPLAEEISTRYTVTYRSARPTTKDLEVDVEARSGAASANLSTVIANPMFVVRVPVSSGLYTPASANRLFFWAAVMTGALCIAFVAFALISRFARPRSRLDHLKYYDQLRGELSEPGEERDAVQSRLVDAVDAVASRHGFTGVIAAKLERAGIPLRSAEWISVHLAAVLIGGFLTEILFDNIVLSLIVIALLAWLPLAYLDRRGNKRTLVFDEQLPDVLSLLAGGLRTGWGLQQSMELVVKESATPASEEFRRAQVEARLGVPLERSLLNIQERMQSEPFDWVVTAIAIQREVGGNLAEVLDNVAKSIRDRESLFRLVSSLTAEGRFSALILSVLPFIVIGLLFVVNSDYILSALLSPFGWAMGVLVFVLLGVGVLWLRAVSRIEY